MMGAAKVDLKRELDHFRARRGHFRLLEVPAMAFLMADGSGDPNTSPAYRAALEGLYPLAYRLKFLSKQELGRDYVVPPLEGLWWADDMAAFTAQRDKSRWHWRLMLMTPPWLGAEHVEHLGDTGEVRWETFSEGLSVQTLHLGPYDDEGPVLARMHEEEIPSRALVMRGRHHEIYLGDPRRSAPEKLRTILRQPVAPQVVERTASSGQSTSD